jgi:YfiH family protein
MITAQALRDLSRVRHAFFTREGGVSEGAFASLNCGFGSGDDPERIASNRARAMTRLGREGDSLTTLYQVHSADVAVVDKPWPKGKAPHADAQVTRTPGVALGILTADCAPVLLADECAGVIGAAHAGWRGALDGVIEAAVAAMRGLGARNADIVAAVGPCIQQASYEVGPEFHARFITADANNARFFKRAARPGHFQYDLPGYVADRLGRIGLKAIEVGGEDTCSDETRFFSYRRTVLKGDRDYGRGLSAIVLEG